MSIKSALVEDSIPIGLNPDQFNIPTDILGRFGPFIDHTILVHTG